MLARTTILILSLLALLHSCLWLYANSGDAGLRDGLLRRAGFTAPERAHQAARLMLVAGDAQARAGAIELHRRLLALNAASPYEWVTAAFALRSGGEEQTANYAVARARELGTAVAPAEMEAVHYYVAAGNLEEVLRTGRGVLGLVRNYDGFLFRYYADLGANTTDILNRGVPGTVEAATAFLSYAMETRDPSRAKQIWQRMTERDQRTRETLGSYTSFLIAEKQPFEAWSAWHDYYQVVWPASEAGTGIFNPGFEHVPVEGPFDWHWTEVPGAQAGLSNEQPEAGRACLRITFSGEENVAYAHASQALVAGPGRYELQAWVKAEGITTNQGVALELTDAGQPVAATEPLTGSSGWQKITARLTLPEKRLLTLRVVRRASLKFDNKIAGTFWLDDVSLKRAN